MTTYSIMMATFASPIPTGTGSSTEQLIPFRNVAKFDFSGARIEQLLIEDDDPNFNDARGVNTYSDATGQTLTNPVTFGNDAAPTPTTVRLTNFIQSTIEMVDAKGVGTGQTFKVLFPYTPPYTVLGGKCAVFIFPDQIAQGDGTTKPAVFDPAASYKFKSYVSYPSYGSDTIPYAPTCFAAGTLIDTQGGPRPVQTLRAGDFVRTRDNGMRRLHWVGGRELSAMDLDLNPAFRPIRILAGALGAGLPQTDLTVSPQHRVLVQSDVARRLFGADQVLVAAKHLIEVPGISVVRDGMSVAYWHVLLDGHELVRSNGAWTESLYTGPQAMKSLSPAARREITMLFPELANAELEPAPARARLFLTGPEGRKLARHLIRKGSALIDA